MTKFVIFDELPFYRDEWWIFRDVIHFFIEIQYLYAEFYVLFPGQFL